MLKMLSSFKVNFKNNLATTFKMLSSFNFIFKNKLGKSALLVVMVVG